jgi:predicted MFS family arabinose efflux permease
VTAIAGLSVAVAGALLLVPADGVALTIAARAVYGLGTGIAAAATITWAVDQVPAERRGRALSVFGMTVWIGLSAGPQLGQAIFDAAGYAAVWAAVAGLEAVGLLIAVLGREGAERPARATRGRAKLVPAGAGRPAALIALGAYGEGVITAFLVLHLIERGVHGGAGFGGAASVYTIFAASVLVFRLAAGGVVDRHRPEMVASAAFAIEAAGLLVLAIAGSFAAAAAGAAIMGGGFAVLFPSLAVVATQTAADEERGAALASFGSAFSLGLALGSLVGGAIAAVGGTGAAHLSAAVAAAAAGAYLTTWRAGRPAAVALAERAP